MYVNGTQRAAVTSGWGATAPADTTSPVQLGRRGDAVKYLAATIDEAAVYGSALSAMRIQAHYAAGR